MSAGEATVSGERQPRIAILDYRMGNLRSVQKAMQLVGGDAYVARSTDEVSDVDGLVLPGVGAFGDAMANLSGLGFIDLLRRSVDSGVPLLGICVGLQVLFEGSNEMGDHRGLALLPGYVTRFQAPLVVPHVGWNQIDIRRPHFLVNAIESGQHAYFTHSYYAEPADESDVVATTEYGAQFASVVARDNVCGVQFHPEKSWRVGLAMLRGYVDSLRR
ncbi:MAG: imidazole glycerol phosphate synthase subunit HisH [Anaerolineae bacterium]